MKKITSQLSAVMLISLSSFSVMAMDSVMTERFFDNNQEPLSQEPINKSSIGNVQSTSQMDVAQNNNRYFDTQGKRDNTGRTIKFDPTR